MTADKGTASFGGWVFLAADALFFAALLFIYGSARARLPHWPDVVPSQVAGAAPVWFATGCLVLSALAYRARFTLLLPLAGCTAALALIAQLWQRAEASGLTPSTGRYGFVVYGLTVVWALHVLAALVILTVAFFRRRKAGASPTLGRFLGFVALCGAVLATSVFVW